MYHKKVGRYQVYWLYYIVKNVVISNDLCMHNSCYKNLSVCCVFITELHTNKKVTQSP